MSDKSSKTNMVILGWLDPCVPKGNPMSSKKFRAGKLRAEGAEIEVVDEVQFLEMLRDPKSAKLPDLKNHPSSPCS